MESDSTEHGFDVVELMREKLPSYIVNRFLAAGYDSKEIIILPWMLPTGKGIQLVK